MSSQHDAWPDGDERFELMFGVPRQALEREGVDVDGYVAAHIRDADDHLYQHFADRLTAGVSVLPYYSMPARISRGRTKFSQSWTGSVTVTASEVRLADESTLAACPMTAVHVSPAHGWFGIGVRLHLGGDGVWYVQPRYCPTSPRRAHKAAKVFVAALAEAGANLTRKRAS